MGFWKKIGESIKKTGKAIAEEIKTRQEIARIKRRILDRFEMKDLKKICKDYGIGEPLPYEEDPFTGKRYKIRITRDHYIDRIMSKLTLEQIKSFAHKNRIDIWDIIKEERERVPKISEVERAISKEEKITKIEIKRQTEFESILELIERDFQDIVADLNIRDEKEFRKHLVVFLRAKLPNKTIEEEVKTRKGNVDILIDNKYALELKYADNKKTLDSGVAEVRRYRELFPHIAVVILDVNKLSVSTLRDYKKYYEQDDAEVIILRGKGVRRKKGKSTQIIIGKRRIRID